MQQSPQNLEALTEALQLFTRTTEKMEEAYRLLESRVQELDRELAQKNRDLAITTDYLSNLLESMGEGVIAVDDIGTITRFNRAAGQILGFDAAQVVGRSFKSVFERDFNAPRQSAQTVLRARSGREVPISERDSPVAGPGGRRLGHVKTFQDLSEVTALREQVRQMDRLAAIGEMAATVAHEIRNPLGGLRGFAALLARDIEESDPRRRLVEKILQGSQALDRVVNELLEYTRPVELRLSPVDFAPIVESALGYVDVGTREITINTRVPQGIRILADADRLRQVLLNVLLNAVQSIEAAGEIEITAQPANTWIELVVRDNGCGMNDEQRERMFSPFYTTKERGTGLGMAISSNIIQGHGGEIAVASAPGAGTEITLRLARAE